MKFLFATVLAVLTFWVSAQTTLPEKTQVQMIVTSDIREAKNKVGEAASFVVFEDVKVDGTVVISKGTAVRATITISKNRELKVDISDVKAVDGTAIKLNDCSVFTTAAQNYNGKGALIAKGTRKSCFTAKEEKIGSSNKQY